MSDYKPTFKPSSAHRPLAGRLTPLAWVLIAIVAFVVIGGGIVGAAVLGGCNRVADWEPTPTATVQPPATEVAVASPTATAEWWAGMVTPTVEATPAFPAWWSEQMTQDENGAWWPPQEVIQMVGDQYAQFRQEHDTLFLTAVEEGQPVDLDAVEAVQVAWTLPEDMTSTLEYIEGLRTGYLQPILCNNWQVCVPQAQEFSADGLECTLGWVCMNGQCAAYDPLVGETLSDPHPVENSGLYLFRMRYDPSDGRWKIDELLRYVSPGGSQ